MNVFQSNAGKPKDDACLRPSDPRLLPTPDYGATGASSDAGLGSGPAVQGAREARQSARQLRLLHLGAMFAGIGLAVAVSSAGGMGAVMAKFGKTSSRRNSLSSSMSRSSAIFNDRDLDRQKPQKQAEILLERAVAHSGGARANGTVDHSVAEIESRVDGWRGKIAWDAQLGDLTTAALNSSDRDVQNSAIEVQIAAYGLAKSESSVDALVRQAASSSNHAQKVWALWSLGLLANRGIETDRVVQVLVSHLNSDGNNEDARRWAVEGLSLVGTTATIAPLLDAMHNDSSATVRERAACSLAQSGMLSHEQRMIAVPQLINYSSDAALDAQTRGWAFQALGDITRQRLPNDAAAWREWYRNSGAGN